MEKQHNPISMVRFYDTGLCKIISCVLSILMLSLSVAPSIQAAEAGGKVKNSFEQTGEVRRLSDREMEGIVGGAESTVFLASPVLSSSSSSASGGTNILGVVNGINVDQFTGTQTMSYPIEVPAGKGGLAPKLSLTYSSTSGNSWCGRGWDLDAGFIIRLGDKNAFPKYDATDKYYYKSGGSSMELANIGGNEWRAKTEGMFLRFVWNGDASMYDGWWDVYDKSGIKYSFGINFGSRTYIGGVGDTKTYKWHLAKIEDVNGNYVNFIYTRVETDINDMYLSNIYYSYTSSTEYVCNIRFFREERSDYSVTYNAGSSFNIQNKYRLKSIVEYVNGVPNRGYKLDYDATNAYRSLLSKLTLYGKDLTADSYGNFTGGSSLTLAEFTYTDITSNLWNDDNSWNLPSVITEWRDGAAYSDPGVRFADVNGDGYVDYVQAIQVIDGSYIKRVFLNNKSGGWTYDANWSSTIPVPFITWHEVQSNEGSLIIDVNGDGLPDFVRGLISGTSSTPVYYNNVWLNTGSGWATESSTWNLPEYIIDWREAAGFQDRGVRFADVNGDGFVDFIRSYQTNTGSYYKMVYINNKATGWTYDAAWSSSIPVPFVTNLWTFTTVDDQTCQRSEGTAIIDINGDGLPDIVRGLISGTSTTPVYYNNVWLNTGSGWAAESATWNLPDYITDWREGFGFTDRGVRFADVNGDGYVDFIRSFQANDGSLYKRIYINNKATGWTYDATWSSKIPVPFVTNYILFEIADGVYTQRSEGAEMVDVNGDGLTDFIRGLGANTWDDPVIYNNVWLLEATSPSELLNKATDNNGGIAEIQYKSSSKTENSGIPYSIFLTSSVTMKDGITYSDGGIHQYATSYDYSNGVYDLSQKEFRGFGSSKTYRTAGGFTDSSRTYFRQGPVTKGRADSVKAWRGATLLSKSVNSWDSTTVWGSISYNWPILKRVDNYVIGTTTTKRTAATYDYDSYGNITAVGKLGEVDLATGGNTGNDETYEITEYVMNVGSWIFKPKRAYVMACDSATILSDTKYYYDDATSIDATPAKGWITRAESWLTNPYPISNPGILILDPWVNTDYAYYETAGDPLYGNLKSVTDARGNAVTYNYDATGCFVVSKTNALTQTEYTTYYGVNQATPYTGLYGQVETQKDPNNTVVTRSYDTFGRLSKVWGPGDSEASPTERYEYHYWWEYAPQITSASSAVVKYTKKNSTEYYQEVSIADGMGRSIQSWKEGTTYYPIVSTILYDSWGKPFKTCMPVSSLNSIASYTYVYTSSLAKWVTSEYDGLGRVIKVTNPDGTFKSVNYDGLKTTKTDENGISKDYLTDVYGRLVQVTEKNSGIDYITSYVYDQSGNLLQINPSKTGDADTIRFYYDSFGRKIKSYDPDRGIWEFEYDLVGNLVKQKDARLTETSFAYDNLNRILTKTNTAGTVSYTYDTGSDGVGRLASVGSAADTAYFGYNSKGQLTTELRKLKVGSVFKPFTIERKYNAAGQLDTLIYPDGEKVPYNYDLHGQITNAGTYASNVTYNNNGQMTAMTYGNGLIGGYVYDDYRLWVNQIKYGTSTTPTSALSLTYGYDNVGNVDFLNQGFSSLIWYFEYDDLYRLANERCMDYADKTKYYDVYTYDEVGNRTSLDGVPYTYYTGKNQLQTDGTRSYTYDANGNVLTYYNGTYGTNYTFNADNRLSRIAYPNNTIDYTYNSVGLRFKKTTTVITKKTKDPALTSINEPYHDLTPTGDGHDDARDLGRITVDNDDDCLTFEIDHKYIDGISQGQYENLYIAIDTDHKMGSGNMFMPDGINMGIEAASAWEYCVYVYDRDNYGIYQQNLNRLEKPAAAGEQMKVEYTSSANGKMKISIPLELLGSPQDIRFMVMTTKPGSEAVCDVAPGDENSMLGGIVYGAESYDVHIAVTYITTITSEYYLYDESGHVLCEMDNAGILKAKNYYLNGQLLARRDLTADPTYQPTYYHNDHLGSPRAMTNASGLVTWRQDYKAFGSDYGTVATGNSYKFNAKPLEANTGLYYYGARYYDPVIGRFVSPDYLGDIYNPQTLSPYVYSLNNPMTLIDPTGEWNPWQHFWMSFKSNGGLIFGIGLLACIIMPLFAPGILATINSGLAAFGSAINFDFVFLGLKGISAIMGAGLFTATSISVYSALIPDMQNKTSGGGLPGHGKTGEENEDYTDYIDSEAQDINDWDARGARDHDLQDGAIHRNGGPNGAWGNAGYGEQWWETGRGWWFVPGVFGPGSFAKKIGGDPTWGGLKYGPEGSSSPYNTINSNVFNINIPKNDQKMIDINQIMSNKPNIYFIPRKNNSYKHEI